jgi:hypothetical protein
MRRLLLIAIALAMTTACARLPEIHLPRGYAPLPSHVRCREVFPQGRWQIHHAIEATVPGGGKTVLTGVTVLDSRKGTLDSALLTVEGFVLFRGRWDGKLTVDRAIRPFDRPAMAEGLMDDLRLLFFAPQGRLCQSGQMAPGERVCRYCQTDHTTIDILVRFDGTRQIRQYDAHHRLRRTIDIQAMTAVEGVPFAKKLTLKRLGVLGYQLNLTLLEAIPLDPAERK